MRRALTLAGLAAAALLSIVNPVRGELVTDSGSMPGPQVVVNFSQFSGLNTAGEPLQVGALVQRDITLTGANPAGFYYGTFSYNLGYAFWTPQNGWWWDTQYGGIHHYVATMGVTYGPGELTFRFNDGPLKAVGAFVNYDPHESTHPTIYALDSQGGILESYDLAGAAPISTPSVPDEGGFRGIVRSQADIYGFRYANGNLVLTNLTFTPKPAANPLVVPIELLLGD